jgi:hypothetical protein
MRCILIFLAGAVLLAVAATSIAWLSWSGHFSEQGPTASTGTSGEGNAATDEWTFDGPTEDELIALTLDHSPGIDEADLSEYRTPPTSDSYELVVQPPLVSYGRLHLWEPPGMGISTK